MLYDSSKKSVFNCTLNYINFFELTINQFMVYSVRLIPRVVAHCVFCQSPTESPTRPTAKSRNLENRDKIDIFSDWTLIGGWIGDWHFRFKDSKLNSIFKGSATCYENIITSYRYWHVTLRHQNNEIVTIFAFNFA